jgi:hypothetical protein
VTQLYNQDGIARFYYGLSYAIILGPLAKFGATASNEIALVIAESLGNSKFAMFIATPIGSGLSASWRVFLMPIDTIKTVLQVEGSHGLQNLFTKVIKGGAVISLYEGSAATFIAALAGHWPWFLVHNYLEQVLLPLSDNRLLSFCRNSFIGLASSLVSDSLSNCIFVVKTIKQASASHENLSYFEIITTVIRSDGIFGFMGRGLGSRILCNGLNSIVFMILWNFLKKRQNNIIRRTSDSEIHLKAYNAHKKNDDDNVASRRSQSMKGYYSPKNMAANDTNKKLGFFTFIRS